MRFLLLIIFLFLASKGATASPVQPYLTIYGGPTYSSATRTGYEFPAIPYQPGSTVGNGGVGVGYAERYMGGISQGNRAIRWDSTGTFSELANLGLETGGASYALAINNSGIAVGSSSKFRSGVNLGYRAVRWNVSGTIATELGNLGVGSTGNTESFAYAINNSNTVVGQAAKYVGTNYRGSRAVRWDGTSTIASELGHLGLNSVGFTYDRAHAINSAGTAVGYALKHEMGIPKGNRPVRWDSDTTSATELGILGLADSGFTDGQAYAINNSAVAVGVVEKYVAGVDLGARAVRWDRTGAATELGILSAWPSGESFAVAHDINSAGAAVGYANKYNGVNLIGAAAVLWDTAETTAIELGHLGQSPQGGTFSFANAINDAGTIIGISSKYDSAGNLGKQCAVYWGTDHEPIELNTLIDPDSGWVNLHRADGISNDGWVSGVGVFDPDGPGGEDSYQRVFLIKVPQVPEASSMILVIGCAISWWGMRTSRGRTSFTPARPTGLD